MKREDIVHEAQTRQLKMLKHFDALCKKHNIEYWCAFGTVLGTVRHHGFIPWDDDIDVGILREDFNRLCAVPEEEWGDEYVFLTPDSDDIRHDKLFGRVYLKNSHIQSYRDIWNWRSWQDNQPWSTSLMLDIFVFDFVPDDKAERDAIYQKVYYQYRRKYLISKIKPVTDKKSLLSKAKCLKEQLQGRVLRIIYKKPWEHYYHAYLKLVENSNKGSMIGCYATTGYDPAAYNSSENIWYYDYDDIYPLVNMQFEDMTVPIPRAWDKLLHLWYDGKNGDYMTLPSEDHRYHIEFVYLDFGDGTVIVVDPIKGSLGEKIAK